VSSAEQATHNGGCGFCNGFGTTLRNGVFPDRALLREIAVERFQLGDAGTLAHAEFDAAAADQIERRDALGNAGRMHGRQLHDAVRQADLLRALAGRGEKDLGGRRVRVFFEEVVLDFPGEVVAEPVGELDLVERILVERVLAFRRPRARQLQLVEYAELHALPSSSDPVSQPIARRRKL